MPSIFSTMTVSTLWAVAGADIFAFISNPYWLALGVAAALGLLTLGRRYVMKAIHALTRS